MRLYGRKIEGTAKVTNVEAYQQFFSSLEEGEEFEIRLTKVKDFRTLQMNNLYWAWLSNLSLHSGYTKRELHNYFKENLLCKESKVNGMIVFDCDSTADLSVKEFSHYLEEVARMAAENFNFVLQPTVD